MIPFETEVRRLSDTLDEALDDITEIRRTLTKVTGLLEGAFGINIINATPEQVGKQLREQTTPEGRVRTAMAKRLSDLTVELVAKDDAVKRLQDELAKSRRLIEPTWTSANGVTRRIREMATAHLENVLGLLYQRGLAPGFTDHGTGLYEAIRRELVRREREAT